jgi:hypothetical protein
VTNFFYWSGFAAWIIGGCVGAFIALDWIIELVVKSFKLKRMFLAFAWDRLKKGVNIEGGA